MTKTTTLPETPEVSERPITDQATEGRIERAEPIERAPEDTSAGAVEETMKQTATTKTTRWFETEPPQDIGEKEEKRTEVKRVRWYEGYRPGYYC